MPTGFKSGQAGNALPLSGEAEMRVASSGTDALTITGHSSQSTAADFLVFRSNTSERTTGGATERFVIGSSGSLRNFQKYVTALSTASTTPAIGASQSGQVFLANGFAESARILLPAPALGLNYTIIQGAGNASQAICVSATQGASAEIRAPFRGSGLSTALVVAAPSTVAGMGAVFVAVSTLTWQMFPFVNGIEGTSAAGEISGPWASRAA